MKNKSTKILLTLAILGTNVSWGADKPFGSCAHERVNNSSQTQTFFSEEFFSEESAQELRTLLAQLRITPDEFLNWTAAEKRKILKEKLEKYLTPSISSASHCYEAPKAITDFIVQDAESIGIPLKEILGEVSYAEYKQDPNKLKEYFLEILNHLMIEEGA